MLKLSPVYGKPLANLVMSLSSRVGCTSVTSLSESLLYHYQYSSICDTIHNIALTPADLAVLKTVVLRDLFRDTNGVAPVESIYTLQIDVCNAEKAATRCFAGRTQNYKANNAVPGNRPVSPGYAVSYLNLCESEQSWSLPLHSQRVELSQSESECAQQQLAILLSDPQLPFGSALTIAVLDSKYGNAAYLSAVYAHENLVNIVRHRSGSKIYLSVESHNPQGAPTQYGGEYFLLPESRTYEGICKDKPYQKRQTSIFDISPHDQQTHLSQTHKGRQLRILITRWNNCKIRTKDGNNMKDKAFDLCCAQVFDAETGKTVFDKPLWFTVNGKRKDQISTLKAYTSYRQRYGIEPFFRFNKQHLFFQDFQTPDSQHFDNWLIVSLLATWLLYAAREELQYAPKKWQKYLPQSKAALQEPKKLTLSQAYHAAESLFCTFDEKPFSPKRANKPHGRRKGEKCKQRPKFSVVKKPKKRRKKDNITPKPT